MPLDAYLGTWSSDLLGDIALVRENGTLTLRTGMYEYDVAHWHLDTFTVDYLSWSYPSFATFRIDPDGRVAALTVFDHDFERITE
ncbi:MAG: DUF3471 domain-containing protein [Woeseiaceae bacterium]|nr:DUF3471 domain-containing protein [Woeseiaceae bacterium]